MKRMLCLAFLFFLCSCSYAADWPQWRGLHRDGSAHGEKLLGEWPEGGPKIRWQATDIGTGYSSPSIANGRVFVQTTRDGKEWALALNEQSGKQLWLEPIGNIGKNRGPQYPGTRSTPTVDGELIYCLASNGELVCLTAESGELKWQVHLKNDLGGEVGSWAYSESTLIDGDWLICTPGGKSATLAAIDKFTGKVVWKSAVPGGDVADYASIMTVDAGNVRQYVQFLRKGLVGVDAKTGDFLWRYDSSVDRGANILTPVVHQNLVFSAGSRSGGGLVELTADDNEVSANEVYFGRELTPSIGGAVLIDGYLYGTTRQSLFCADFTNGKVQWTERVVGAASLCYADGRLYVRGHKSGDVVLVEPSPEGFKKRGRLKQASRSSATAWPHPVVANGGLYLRDEGTLLCYQVSAN